MLQVLAVNILGRFLLNNDRNIRLVLFSSDLCSSSLSNPPLYAFLLPFLSLRVISPFQANGKLTTAKERNLPTGSYRLSWLITFSRAITLQPHQKVTLLTAQAELSISDHVIFQQALLRFPEGFIVLQTFFWVRPHKGPVGRQVCLVSTLRSSESLCCRVTGLFLQDLPD